MTRARFCVGDAPLGVAFEAVRRQVLCAPRDLAQLALEITQMREKMRAAHAVPAALFDYKHSVGGMIDAEFVVQYLVLAHAQAHPTLQDNVGNIALLHRAEAAGLLPSGLGAAAADAYRELRHLQHQARLDERVGRSEEAAMLAHSSAIKALWTAVFS